MLRTAAREVAIQLGFSVTCSGIDPQTAIDDFLEPSHFASLAEEDPVFSEKPSAKDLAFITQSVSGVAARREELDALIGRYAHGWRTERISKTAAAVMRQAIFEMLYMEDIPAAASINEAVELAKGYEDPETVAFINGVLGGFYRGEIGENRPEQTETADE